MTDFTITYSDELINRIASLLDNRPVRLASRSPRRREILKRLGIEFSQFTPNSEDEFEPDVPESDPVARSLAMTKHKAAEGCKGVNSGIVIAADTIVVLDSRVLFKPIDRADAISHLKRLAGKDHYVHTSMVVRDVDRSLEECGTSDSRVTFRDVSEAAILDYVATGEPDDKAGAYGIQGMGKFLVDKYTGHLDNIIGFPAYLFVELLEGLKRHQV
ncbi:MAG: septum formation protein Maf [candidate division Zixibacteria bacterium]|nr:septum formation protein Maf [candidate division Zixibacteria bacterium]MBU1470579.1 septum formation protein Maf [candidate division Zixibacteria bacterium]MBU2624446.1 septum formation protein Maf [candidate division Zixibacteria bacterium]